MIDRNEIAKALAEYEAEHEFARQIVLPIEDQLRVGQPRCEITYRWFRSPNVIDLVKVRRLKLAGRL